MASGSGSNHDEEGRTRAITDGGRSRRSALDGLDLEVNTRRKTDALVEGIDGLVVGLIDVDQALVRADLKLLA